MLNETVIDDGTIVTEEELRDIRTRAQSTRYAGVRVGVHGQIHWGTDDSLEQALADRSRLLRVLDSGGGAIAKPTESPAARLVEEKMAHGLTAVRGRFRTDTEAREAVRDYERVWPPVYCGTALTISGRADTGFAVNGTRATGDE